MPKARSLKKTSVQFIDLNDAEKARLLNAYTKKVAGDLSQKIKELRAKKKTIELEIKEIRRIKKELCKKNKK